MPPVKLVQCTSDGCKTNETSGNVVLRHPGGDRPFWYLIIRIRNMIRLLISVCCFLSLIPQTFCHLEKITADLPKGARGDLDPDPLAFKKSKYF